MRALGELIQDCTRASDLVAHLGNGRFIIILLGSNLSGGRIAADRVETRLAEVATGPVCMALASYQREMKESSELLEALDQAIRQAEAAGGGLVMAD